MKKTISLILGLAAFFTVAAQPADKLFLSAAVEKLQHSKDYTLKVAAAMPADKYGYKPTKEEMSFSEQLLHLSSGLAWLGTTYLGGSGEWVSKKDMELKTKPEIILVITRAYDSAISVLQRFPPSGLADTAGTFAGVKTKLQIINLLNDHQTHHRAQMLVYLRLNGIKPPDYVAF